MRADGGVLVSLVAVPICDSAKRRFLSISLKELKERSACMLRAGTEDAVMSDGMFNADKAGSVLVNVCRLGGLEDITPVGIEYGNAPTSESVLKSYGTYG